MVRTFIIRAGCFVLILAVGVMVGLHWGPTFSESGFGSWAHPAFSLGDENLLSPFIDVRNPENTVSLRVKAQLKKQTQTIIEEAGRTGEVTFASVYFRDLNNGPWFGINEDAAFSPVSLLKVPLAMSFYEEAQSNPAILDQRVIYKASGMAFVDQFFVPRRNLEDGKSYSVKELIAIMLQESSNESALLLAELVGHDQITSTYTNLGLDPPSFGAEYEINPQRYTSFFRVLYNAEYVSRDASQEILEMLTQASFLDGLVAGVPSSITVAHKFGSRKVEGTGDLQLHDCGIVYAPNKPYLLCVMTHGKDFGKLANFTKSVSELVYKTVTSEKSP